ncbi:MAG: hypothetical protein R3194_01195 [Limnobacter sp.]|nr:hypothetical protein [Limnobacter sp.]
MDDAMNQQFLSDIEARTRKALVEGRYQRDSIVNPATILMLLSQLQAARDANKVAIAEGEYHQGYRDGWADARMTPAPQEKAVAWAILVKGEGVVKVYSEPPTEIAPDAECRPLYIKSPGSKPRHHMG